MSNTQLRGINPTEAGRRKLPESVMVRVRACALIFLDSSRYMRILVYAYDSGLSIEDAANAYTIGCLKRIKRQGRAATYAAALDILEAEQVSDRGMVQPSTALTREVARINYINDKAPMYVSTDNGSTWAKQDSAAVKAPKSAGMRNYGRVIGTLYAQWDARQTDADPANIMMDADAKERRNQVKANLTRYYTEYVTHLSPTCSKRLRELVNSNVSSDILTSVAGRADPNTIKMATFARNLHYNWEHKDAITCREFIDQLREYAPIA